MVRKYERKTTAPEGKRRGAKRTTMMLSDPGGIRRASMKQPTPSIDEAKKLQIACALAAHAVSCRSYATKHHLDKIAELLGKQIDRAIVDPEFASTFTVAFHGFAALSVLNDDLANSKKQIRVKLKNSPS
jgi:hypothetical protein